MSQLFLIREKVFKARLRTVLEPVDFVVKNLASDCVKSTGADTPQELFGCLKDWQSQFWERSFPNAMPIVMEWANQASAALLPQGRPMGFFVEDLKTKIWQNLLQRISLDSWMILGRDIRSQGNQLLEITMRVVEDTIYSQFPLMDDSLPVRHAPLMAPVHRVREPLPPAPAPVSAPIRAVPDRVPASSQFETLFENSDYTARMPPSSLPNRASLSAAYGSAHSSAPTPGYVSGYGSTPASGYGATPVAGYGSTPASGYGSTPASGYETGSLRTPPVPVASSASSDPRLGPIPELGDETNERELALLKNSSRNVYLPRTDGRGMPIRLRRMNTKAKDGPSNKSRSRKKKSGRRRRKDRDEDDDDETTTRDKTDSYGVDSDSDEEE